MTDLMGHALLDAVALSKSYRGKPEPALRDCSLRVTPGEIIALVGHNGAGKSTLLDILGGLTRPDRGSVLMGVDAAEIGWCPQREIVDWSLTVRQNIGLGLDLRRRMRRGARGASIDDLAALLGLTKHLDRTAETLSGGELRRTQIARAMAGDLRLLVLDEPTTGLDPTGIATVFDFLAQRRRDGGSALISTHETSRFARYCTRVVALDSGSVIADEPAPDFVARGNDHDDLWSAYEAIRSRGTAA